MNSLLNRISCADDYDPNSMAVDKARAFIARFLVPVAETERLPVRASLGRVLAEDIGVALGCGAHVATLRRSRAGPFSEAGAVSLDVLEELRANRAFEELDKYLLPASSALSTMRRAPSSGVARSSRMGCTRRSGSVPWTPSLHSR